MLFCTTEVVINRGGLFVKVIFEFVRDGINSIEWAFQSVLFFIFVCY